MASKQMQHPFGLHLLYFCSVLGERLFMPQNISQVIKCDAGSGCYARETEILYQFPILADFLAWDDAVLTK